MLKKFIFLILAAFGIGCSVNNTDSISVDSANHLQGEIVTEIGNLWCLDILESDSLIIINDWSDTNGFFTVYNRAPFRKVGTYVQNGNGPNEFLSPFFFKNIVRSNSDFQFSAFDLNKKLIREYSSIDQMLENNVLLPCESTQIPDQIFPSLNLSFYDSVFYGQEISMSSGLFFSYNVNTKEKKSATFKPEKFAAKYSGYEYPFFYFNNPIVNIVENRIVTGMKYFNEIYFYDLDLNPLKTITIGSMTLPGLFNNATVTDESYLHTVDMCATDKYIYVLYDRRMEKEYEESTWGTSTIIILDWEGGLINSYTIRRSSIISVDPANSFLLAFSRDDPNGSAFYRYKLSLQ